MRAGWVRCFDPSGIMHRSARPIDAEAGPSREDQRCVGFFHLHISYPILMCTFSLDFATKKPHERLRSIVNGLEVRLINDW